MGPICWGKVPHKSKFFHYIIYYLESWPVVNNDFEGLDAGLDDPWGLNHPEREKGLPCFGGIGAMPPIS